MPLRRNTVEQLAPREPVVRLRSRLESAYQTAGSDVANLGTRRVLSAWRSRRLEPFYPLVFIDALTVSVRANGFLTSRDIHLALGVLPDGTKDIISFWMEAPRADSFWPGAIDGLKRRGVDDILLAVVEDRATCGEALARAFPRARIQSSVKRFEQRLLTLVPRTERSAVEASVSGILDAPGRRSAEAAFRKFANGEFAAKNPLAQSFLRKEWRDVSLAFDLPPALRELVRTTTAVESLTAKLRRRGVAKRSNFPSEDAAARELVLVLRDAPVSWKVAPNKWLRAQKELVQLDTGTPFTEPS